MYVSDDHWFTGTVSRRKVKANLDFARLMALVESDKVGTVFVESQDRWGTKDRVELFTLLGTLREHKTALYDLRAGRDLTESDFAGEMLTIITSFKSETELKDLAFRSLRSRVQLFLETGSWPTGSHPYGYGKKCHAPGGALKWTWIPTCRGKGQLYFPDETGTLKPVGPPDAKIPPKTKGGREVTKLVPGRPDYVRAVKLVYDLYARVGLSRRAISKRLNDEGLKFNDGLFTHPDVTNILKNPAYLGDTHFGKVQTGDLSTFDPEGLIIPVKGKRDDKSRPIEECLVKKDTHEALIDRETWDRAQERLARELEECVLDVDGNGHARRTPPRNPAY